MRLIVAMFVPVLAACSSERESETQQPASRPVAATVEPPVGSTVSASKAALMAIPDDPEALKRLEAMGYTIHREQGHLHPPGVTSCPAMGGGVAM